MVRADHYASNRHDTGSTTARSVDEVALIQDTLSRYTPVLIAPFVKSVAPACREFFSRQVAAPFRDLLPLLNSRHITLPQHNRLIAQIVGLERHISRAGKDSIAPASQGQDDLVNAVAGCAAALHKKFYDPFMDSEDDDDPDGSRAWQRYRLWQHIIRYG